MVFSSSCVNWKKIALSCFIFSTILYVDNVILGLFPNQLKYLLKGAREQKYQELAEQPSLSTRWQDVYEDMVRPLRHNNSVDESYLKTKKQCLETVFELIDKQYVEQITLDDCRRFNKLIYFVPKKWRERHPNKRLADVLLPKEEDKDKTISSAIVPKIKS